MYTLRFGAQICHIAKKKKKSQYGGNIAYDHVAVTWDPHPSKRCTMLLVISAMCTGAHD